jgi:hypothetical protein
MIGFASLLQTCDQASLVKIAPAARSRRSIPFMKSISVVILFLSCIYGTWAGCPSALGIYNCNGPRNPCLAKSCPDGQVCHVNNCGGCTANCEAPGMVHIMSVGAPQDNQEGLVELITGRPTAARSAAADSSS